MATVHKADRGGSPPSRKGSSSRKPVATKPSRSTRRRGPVERQYVAIDLHSRRSLIVRQNAAGEELSVVRIDNDPVAL